MLVPSRGEGILRTAILRGFENTLLERISCIAEEHVAIALSRGGAKKTYHHRDPNEDACGFAFGEHGTLLVVADGHSGCDASQIAVEYVLEHLAPVLIGGEDPGVALAPEQWQTRALDHVLAVHGAILQQARIEAEHPSRTTLAIAFTRTADDRIGWINAGDSLLYRDGGDAPTPLETATEKTIYIGSPRDDRERLAQGVRAGVAPLAGARALVLASDGLSEEGIGVEDPANAVREALGDAARAAHRELHPLEAARGLAEIANRSHAEQKAGDNIATAVAWLA